MKKILISVRDLKIGGVQKSLVDFLAGLEPEINAGEYKVDLLVLNPEGEFRNQINKNINIFTPNKKFYKFGLTNNGAKAKGKGIYLKRSITAVWCKIFSNHLPLKLAIKKQKNLGDYDIAISYAVTISKKSMYAGWSELVLEKCNAKKKVVYIHNDYVNSAINNSNTYKLLKRFDEIWFVSKSCENMFLETYKEFNGKTDYLYNFVNSEDVKIKANETCDMVRHDGINLISVSRLSSEKAHIRSLNVLRRLRDNGYKFFWHILGDGPENENLTKKIIEYGLENQVKLYGSKANPYPYMKMADLLVLNSYNESFGLVLIESMLVGVPVFTTNTVSAKEVVGELGIVCDNTEDAIYLALEKLLKNPEQIKDLKQKLKNYKYDNKKIKNKLKEMIDYGK